MFRVFIEISRICNLKYIPRNTTNVTIRNLEWKKREFINDKNYQVFNAFSTLTTNNKTLTYIIKKTLLYYMIAIILYTKKNYELQKIKNQHKIIKRWLKKVLPKPLKQSVREYNKRAKVREKERQKQARANRIDVREIQFRPMIDSGDMDVKIKKIREFIEDGDKVKIMVRFRGREMAHKDNGFAICNKLLEEVENAVKEVQEAKEAINNLTN